MPAAGTFVVVMDPEEVIGGEGESGRLTVRFQGGSDYALFGGDELRVVDKFSRTGNQATAVQSGYELVLPTDIGGGGDFNDSLIGYDLTWFTKDATVPALFKSRPAGSTWMLSELLNPEQIPTAESTANAARAEAAADEADEARDEAVAAASTATAISGLTGEDDAVALLQTTPASDLRAAQRKVLGGRLYVTDPRFAGGAVGDGTTDDTPAFNAWLDALVDAANSGDPLEVEGVIPPGTYRLTSALERRDAAIGLVIRGAGAAQTFLYGDFVGAGKGILDLSSVSSTRASGKHRVSGIGFLGNNTPGDPVGLLMENAWLNEVSDISGPAVTDRTLNNSALVVTNDNNSKWDKIHSQAGFQPKAFPMSTTARVSFTSAGTTVTATEAVFASDMVGQPIYFETGGNTGSHNIWSATIASYTDSTHVVLATAAPSTATGVRAIVGHITGSITNGSNQLVLAKVDGLSTAWVGMTVHVVGASAKASASNTAGLLSTTITAVNVGTRTLTLGANASATVTGATVVFPPALFLGTLEGRPTVNETNHSWWGNVHTEGFSSVGMIINKALYLSIDRLKIHGSGYGDWGQCYWGAMFSEIGQAVEVGHMQSNYGIFPEKIHVSGSSGTLSLGTMSFNALTPAGPAIRVTTARTDFRLTLGDISLSALTNFPDTWRLYETAVRGVVESIGTVSHSTQTGKLTKAAQSPVHLGATANHGSVAVADETAVRWKPPGTWGILHLSCSGDGIYAFVAYRTSEHTAGGLIQSMILGTRVDLDTTGTTFTGTTGTDGRVRVGWDSSGNLQFENRRGFQVSLGIYHTAYGAQ